MGTSASRPLPGKGPSSIARITEGGNGASLNLQKAAGEENKCNDNGAEVNALDMGLHDEGDVGAKILFFGLENKMQVSSPYERIV